MSSISHNSIISDWTIYLPLPGRWRHISERTDSLDQFPDIQTGQTDRSLAFRTVYFHTRRVRITVPVTCAKIKFGMICSLSILTALQLSKLQMIMYEMICRHPSHSLFPIWLHDIFYKWTKSLIIFSNFASKCFIAHAAVFSLAFSDN